MYVYTCPGLTASCSWLANIARNIDRRLQMLQHADTKPEPVLLL